LLAAVAVAEVGAAFEVLEAVPEAVAGQHQGVPAVGEPPGEFDRLRAHPGRLDRGHRVGRVTAQPESLEVEVLAVVGDWVPGEHLLDDLDGLAGAPERVAEVGAVPVFDDDGTGWSEAEAEPAVGDLLECRGRLSDERGRAGVHRHDRGADVDGLGGVGDARKRRDGVPAPGLGEPGGVVAQLVGEARLLDEGVDARLGGDRQEDVAVGHGRSPRRLIRPATPRCPGAPSP
jgi:hypothetical protein